MSFRKGEAEIHVSPPTSQCHLTLHLLLIAQNTPSLVTLRPFLAALSLGVTLPSVTQVGLALPGGELLLYSHPWDAGKAVNPRRSAALAKSLTCSPSYCLGSQGASLSPSPYLGKFPALVLRLQFASLKLLGP